MRNKLTINLQYNKLIKMRLIRITICNSIHVSVIHMFSKGTNDIACIYYNKIIYLRQPTHSKTITRICFQFVINHFSFYSHQCIMKKAINNILGYTILSKVFSYLETLLCLSVVFMDVG